MKISKAIFRQEVVDDQQTHKAYYTINYWKAKEHILTNRRTNWVVQRGGGGSGEVGL